MRIPRFHSGSVRSVVLAGTVIALLVFFLGALTLNGSVADAARRHPTPTPVPTPGPGGPPWLLIDNHQRACFDAHVTSAYYGIWITGKWTRPINVGITRLPAGGTFWTSYAPIPPGSSDGIGSLAYVGVQIPATTPVGTYLASLWASDGPLTESVPVTLSVQLTCGY